MFTDPKRIRLMDKGHPKVCNVFSYYSIFGPELKDEVFDYCSNAKLGCTDCKKRLASRLIKGLEPIAQRRAELSKDRAKIIDILQQGRLRVSGVAAQTLSQAKEAMKL